MVRLSVVAVPAASTVIAPTVAAVLTSVLAPALKFNVDVPALARVNVKRSAVALMNGKLIVAALSTAVLAVTRSTLVMRNVVGKAAKSSSSSARAFSVSVPSPPSIVSADVNVPVASKRMVSLPTPPLTVTLPAASKLKSSLPAPPVTDMVVPPKSRLTPPVWVEALTVKIVAPRLSTMFRALLPVTFKVVVLAEVNKPIAESPPVVLMVSVSTPAIVVATVVAWDMLETLTVAESAEPVTSEYVIV